MNFDLLHGMGQFLSAQTTTTPATGATGQGGFLLQLAPMLLMFGAIMYFMTIRPQQKRDRERQEMLSALSKGDKVVTTGGICGEVVGISDANVVLRVDDGCKIEFVKAAIAQVAPRERKETK